MPAAGLVLIAASCAAPGRPAPAVTTPRPASSAPPTATGAVADTARPATTATAGPVLVYGDCRSPTLQPSEIVLACADHGWVLRDLRWSTWTASAAKATGTFVYNDCSPNCAAGHLHSVPGTRVTLTAPVRGAGGTLVWSRLVQDPAPPGYSSGPYHGGPFPLPTRPV